MTARTPVAAPPVPRWRAFDRAGVGHAFVTRRSLASACLKVLRPPDEMHDWPRKSKCTACVEALSPEAWDQADRESMVVPHVGGRR